MTGVAGAALLKMNQVRKSYKRGSEQVFALRDVDLTLNRGEVVAIFGPSGSGKTTLLNLCAGWERPDDGTIGWHLPDTQLDTLPWRAIAVVPQDLGLLEELSVLENVSLPRTISRAWNDQWDARARELMHDLDLQGLGDRLTFEISRGQQQRVALARALLERPELLLADEPTAHQGDVSAASIFERLRQVAAGGTCCVVATHDEEVARNADRVVQLRDGAVLRDKY